jgi:hypothetical protein
MYVREEEPVEGFVGGNTRKRGHLEDLVVDGRIILKQILQK